MSTSVANNIVLILGAGPRVGASVVSRFLADGYKVALASRSGQGIKSQSQSQSQSQSPLALKADLSVPAAIPPLFDAVRKEFGASPNIVVYNAAGMTPPPDAENVFSIPVEAVTKDLTINTVSAYAAAQEAVKGWAGLSGDVKKAFIYTGNILNITTLPIPSMLNLGTGKAATASWIELVDGLYAEKGYRFFYADQRKPDGKPAFMDLDGPAHADFYAQLASTAWKDVPWHATFVKDQGYAKF